MFSGRLGNCLKTHGGPLLCLSSIAISLPIIPIQTYSEKVENRTAISLPLGANEPFRVNDGPNDRSWLLLAPDNYVMGSICQIYNAVQ